MTERKNPEDTPQQDSYLPDFCEQRVVLAVILIAELVAIILTLARQEPAQVLWLDLARTSLLLLWIALTGAAVLCYTRPLLARYDVATATTISFILLLITTALVSEAAYWAGRYWTDRVTVAGTLLFPTQRIEFLFRNLGIATIVIALVLRYFYVTHEWRRNIQMEARSRIDALQARIRPHFLFNSMNTIASLTRSNPEKAEEAVEDLADLFRATLTDSKNVIRMKEELEVARIYQRIEQLRLGDRLQVVWDVTDLPLRCSVPSLTVQPLLENAIYHGIEVLPDGGQVTVTGSREDEVVRITVSNPIPNDPKHTEREGNRIALENIRQRLELTYPGEASVETENQNGNYVVTLKFPFVEIPL